MRYGLALALFGIVIGVPLGLALMQGVPELLLDVQVISSSLAAASAITALAIAALASLGPALSALATEPSQVLRGG